MSVPCHQQTEATRYRLSIDAFSGMSGVATAIGIAQLHHASENPVQTFIRSREPIYQPLHEQVSGVGFVVQPRTGHSGLSFFFFATRRL